MAQQTAQRMVIAYLGVNINAEQDQEIVSTVVPDPKTGSQQCCCMVTPQGDLLEVQHFKAKYSSWLMPKQLLADGGLYLATPVDPLFILLPILESARNQGGSASNVGVYTALDQLLDNVNPDQCKALTKVLEKAKQSLTCICDEKDMGGDVYIRLNNDKVLAWLLCKCQQAKQALSQQLMGIDSTAQDQYVVSFLSEYLSTSWITKLSEHFQLDMTSGDVTTPLTDNKTATNQQPPEKKIKVDPKELAKEAAKKRAAEAKAAVVAKQAAGCKKISSFFVKKA